MQGGAPLGPTASCRAPTAACPLVPDARTVAGASGGNLATVAGRTQPAATQGQTTTAPPVQEPGPNYDRGTHPETRGPTTTAPPTRGLGAAGASAQPAMLSDGPAAGAEPWWSHPVRVRDLRASPQPCREGASCRPEAQARP